MSAGTRAQVWKFATWAVIGFILALLANIAGGVA